MVTSGHVEMLGQCNFPGQQGQNDLNGEGTSINEVTVEEVRVLLTGHAINIENVEQIVELTMDVTTDGDLFKIVDFDPG